jgi:glycosyltransferase involved in cell wall biosynthesis
MESLRVLMIAKSINFAFGGGLSRHTYELVKALKKHGCDVTVACMSKPENSMMNTNNKILVSYFHLPILDLVSFNLNMLRKNLGNNVNIVHSQLSDGFIFSAVKKAPFVVTAHTSGVKDMRYVPKLNCHLVPYATCVIEKYMHRKADRIIAVSRYVAESIQNDYGVSKDKIVFIPNGVDTQKFNPNINAEVVRDKYNVNGHLLLCVTRLAMGRFVEDLIPMAKAVSKAIPNVKIIIVGDGPLKHYLEKLRDQQRLTENIIFVGRIDEELPYFYNAADLCFLPGTHNPIELTMLEAWACGKPVVYIKRIKTEDDQLYNKTYSYESPIIAVNNIKEFVNSVVYLLKNENERKSLGIAARNTVIKHMSWERIAEKTINVYQSLLS